MSISHSQAKEKKGYAHFKRPHIHPCKQRASFRKMKAHYRNKANQIDRAEKERKK